MKPNETSSGLNWEDLLKSSLNSKQLKFKLSKTEIEEIENYILENIPFKQKAWHWFHQTPSLPKCKGNNCNRTTKFKNAVFGYREFCSHKCSDSSDIVKKRVEKTSLERYGVKRPSMSEEVKKVQKETNIKKWGSFYLQTEEFKERSKNTLLEKWGVNHNSKLESVKKKMKETKLEKWGDPYYNNREKYKETCIEKWGVDNYRKTNEWKEKLENIIMEKYGIPGSDYFHKKRTETCFSNWGVNYPMQSPFFQQKAADSVATKRKTQNQISSFLTSLQIKHETDNRIILEGKELDIFIPHLNLAIEFNGLYWHSSIDDSFKGVHLEKTEMCNKKGIRLIHIWEDEWIYKKDLVKGFIKDLVLKPKRVGARKCEIRKIGSSESKQFLENYHFQGNINAPYRWGLYFNDELVQVMTFGSLRKSMGSRSLSGNYELYRLCTKPSFSIIGGAGKLLNAFIKEHDPTKIISYCNLSKFTGNVYESIGMTKVSKTRPNYHFVIGGKRVNRFALTKHKLVEMGADRNLSESQITKELSIRKIWDCGQSKYELVFNK